MNIIGIEIKETFENSAAYIKAWSKKLKDDVKIIITAAGQAQKAADLIMGKEAVNYDSQNHSQD
jgi:antirestriction protein ArdC